MATATFNQGVDYFGLESASSNALKVKSSNENRSDSLAEGANGKGDVVAQDRYGVTASPSSEYSCVADVTLASIKLGTVTTIAGFSSPIMLTSLSFSTSATSEITCSASGVMVETGATTKRTYTLPTATLSKRHRAQDIYGILAIKKGSATATDTEAEITSATYNCTCESTLASPKGVVLASDCHGGKVEAQFTIGCWATGISVELTQAATTAGWTLSASSKSDPENGYTEMTVTANLAIIGADVTQPVANGGGAE